MAVWLENEWIYHHTFSYENICEICEIIYGITKKKMTVRVFLVCLLLCFFELFSPSHAHQKSQLNGKMRQNGLLIKVVCWKQNRFFTKWVINSYYCWLLSFNCFFLVSFWRVFLTQEALRQICNTFDEYTNNLILNWIAIHHNNSVIILDFWVKNELNMRQSYFCQPHNINHFSDLSEKSNNKSQFSHYIIKFKIFNH